MRVLLPRFDRTPSLTTDFSAKKRCRAVIRLLSVLVVFAIPAVVQASSLPAAIYAADAYPDEYNLPPCGFELCRAEGSRHRDRQLY
jgi:hypothetical protein